MKVNVVFKVYLNNRNKLGQFNKTIAKVCSKDENEYLQVGLFRMNNNEVAVRYILGHIKEDELNSYTVQQ